MTDGMINACQLKGSHSVVTIHSSRYRFSPPKFWEGGSEARSGGFICTCMSKLTIKKNYILSYVEKLIRLLTHTSSPLPSASPLSRGDFSLHRPLAGEIFPSPGEEDVSTADRFVFPRAAGNTRSPSCGDTAPGAAGNTGTCRKCRATACLKPLSAQVQATARARSALYKLVRAANHILPFPLTSFPFPLSFPPPPAYNPCPLTCRPKAQIG